MNEEQNFEYLKFKNEKEELHQVFATVLDTFPNITGASISGQTFLWEALQRIKYNLGNDIDSYTYLLPKYIDGKKNLVYDKRKVQLPAICYNASYRGYKDTAHIKSINNLMFLDIDDFPTKQEALEYKKQIIGKYKWIVACNLSLSRLGLHVIALVDEINNSEDYIQKYKFISESFFDMRLDKNSNKLTQYTVLPADYNIYINENPEVLPIEQIYAEYKKSISSAYLNDSQINYNSTYRKSIRSAYNTEIVQSENIERSIRSVHKRKEIICTAHTFFSNSDLSTIMNEAARQFHLRFQMEVNEDLINDPNEPIYVRDGIEVMEVNFFSLKGKKVCDGHRHDFIGALTVRMLYLNAGSNDKQNEDSRQSILKYILYVNNTLCEPPMKNYEVIKSYNANWKRFRNDEMDFSKYFIKKRAFWSKHSTLIGNEKRKVTCKIKNEPVVEESKRRIYNALESLMANNSKITQDRVEKTSGMSIATVKKYWNEFKDVVKIHNMELSGKQKSSSNSLPENQNTEEILPVVGSLPAGELNQKIIEGERTDFIEIQNVEKIDFDEDTLVLGEEFNAIAHEINPQIIFERIFEITLKRLDEKDKSTLFEEFNKNLITLPQSDINILSIDVNDIVDDKTFFRQSTLESQIRQKCINSFSIKE
ncbi:MAG: hypothetical protein GYA51_01550 [Candidatus Methanofastidiosa archaeon]|nr:hypothetical protein [Candidatus Methanofastidiosa archaeon]